MPFGQGHKFKLEVIKKIKGLIEINKYCFIYL